LDVKAECKEGVKNMRHAMQENTQMPSSSPHFIATITSKISHHIINYHNGHKSQKSHLVKLT